jgi:hypothetical protein
MPLAQNYPRCPATPPSTTVDAGLSQICELSPKSSVQWMCGAAAVANMRVLRIKNEVGVSNGRAGETGMAALPASKRRRMMPVQRVAMHTASRADGVRSVRRTLARWRRADVWPVLWLPALGLAVTAVFLCASCDLGAVFQVLD